MLPAFPPGAAGFSARQHLPRPAFAPVPLISPRAILPKKAPYPAAPMAMRPAPRPGSSTIQAMAAHQLDRNVLHDELWDDLEGRDSLWILDRVHLYTCTGITFTDPATGIAVPDPNTLGITFPHENPPVIVVNLTPHVDNQHLAHTIFHEARHAFDPTPPRHLNTAVEKNIDIDNEINTWIRELNFSIRKQGQEFHNNVAAGFVVPDGHGGHQVDPNLRASVIANYQGYLLDNRTDRFTMANYTFANQTRITIPRRGFASTLAGGADSLYNYLPSAGTALKVGVGLAAVGAAVYFGKDKLRAQFAG